MFKIKFRLHHFQLNYLNKQIMDHLYLICNNNNNFHNNNHNNNNNYLLFLFNRFHNKINFNNKIIYFKQI